MSFWSKMSENDKKKALQRICMVEFVNQHLKNKKIQIIAM